MCERFVVYFLFSINFARVKIKMVSQIVLHDFKNLFGNSLLCSGVYLTLLTYIVQGVKFLFFVLPPIFSYFFMKFLVFPIFRVLLGTQKHFDILSRIKLINSTKI